MNNEFFTIRPIGYMRHNHSEIPRHCSVSNLEAEIIINKEYLLGIRDIKSGDIINVLFYFHNSPSFTPEKLIAKPPHLGEERGVFSTCSPVRPNPIGLSTVEVVDVIDNIIRIKHVDMIDGTPVIDIKPYVPFQKT